MLMGGENTNRFCPLTPEMQLIKRVVVYAHLYVLTSNLLIFNY